MKIVQIKTNMAVGAGSPKREMHFTTEAHSMHRGLNMTAIMHPKLGSGVMIETEALKKKGHVSFVGMGNIEEIVFAQDAAEEVANKGPKKV